MDLVFKVNPQLDIPIYQQLVDTVRAAVRKGTLMPGQQLPTVQELAANLAIARGTIKRAYDELEHLGILEKVQGRGTFICDRPADSPSRKDRAMAAIDSLLDELEGMGFSDTEINIFLSLKQRERTQQLSKLQLAVVECNTETLSQLSEQLRSVKGVELHSYLMDNIKEYPYKLDENVDLVITTAEHAAYIESVLSDPDKLARVALRLSTDTLSGILRLRSGELVHILTFSNRFGELVHRTCSRYAPQVKLEKPILFSAEDDVVALLDGKSTVLVPRDYEKYCSAEIARGLRWVEKKGKLLMCAYKPDEGSFLTLEEKLAQLRRSRESVR